MCRFQQEVKRRNKKIIKFLKTKFIIASSVAVVTFIVYSPSLRNEFVNWDDNVYVYENPFIRSLNTQLLKSAFTEFHAYNWHPLTWLSHAIDYAIWGLNPLGHHLTNNSLHALNTLMVVFLVMKLMEVYKKTAGNNGVSNLFTNDRTVMITGAATGLLFGLHPLHVESVAWISERKDLLCAFFFLLSIMTYIQYVNEGNSSASSASASRFFNKKYLLTIVFFILSLLSKPMAVTLPLVLLIIDWYPLRRVQSLKTFRAAAIEKLPFLALTLISSILTLFAQKAGGAMKSVEAIPLASRMIVAAKSLVAYLYKMMLPINLVPLYPYPRSISLFSSEYISPIVITIVITVACIAIVRKQRLWMSVWSYYVITVMPVLGIVQVGDQAMADRYTYLPSIGLFMLAGIAVAMLMEKTLAMRKMALSTSLSVGLLLAILFVAFQTTKQIGIWKTSFDLWNYEILNYPEGSSIAYNNRAILFHGRNEINKAIADYTKAIELNPLDPDYYNNRGAAYIVLKESDKALKDYIKVLEIKKKDFSAAYNMACLYSVRKEIDQACRWFEKSVEFGYKDWEHIREDSDLANIRNEACYKKLMVGK